MISFSCLSFEELSLHQLYELLALRQEVFAVEQDCVYQDADGKDQQSWHLLGCDDRTGKLLAYCRLMPKGLVYEDYIAIGRVITAQEARGKGLGKKLMQEGIREIQKLLGAQAIKISAQSYLQKFYSELGFEATGEEYLEDGIPHIAMIRKNSNLDGPSAFGHQTSE